MRKGRVRREEEKGIKGGIERGEYERGRNEGNWKGERWKRIKKERGNG